MAPDVTSTVSVSFASAAPVTAIPETEPLGREVTAPSTVTTISAALADTVMLLPAGLPITVQVSGGPRASTPELEPDATVVPELAIGARPSSLGNEPCAPAVDEAEPPVVDALLLETPLVTTDPSEPSPAVAPKPPAAPEACGSATGAGVGAPERSGAGCPAFESAVGAESCVVPSVAVTATLASTVTVGGSAGAGVLWSDRVV